MKERLMRASEGSDMPTVTYVTTKAIIFYISAGVTIVCMFLNWFALDIDIPYLNLNAKEVLGTVNVFTLPGALSEIMDSPWLSMLPEIKDGLSGAHFISIVLMLAAVASIGCLGFSVYFRLRENDKCVLIGRLGAIFAAAASIGFIVLVNSSIGSFLRAIDATEAAESVMQIVLTGPCAFTLIAAVVVAICAVRDMGFKENVVIYHNGIMKIDNGPLWRCSCCHRRNLSLLKKCYYCGNEK